MSLKRWYYDKGSPICLTCKFIDEYAFNVNGEGEIPHGYDGTALCGIFDENEKEGGNNREYISPRWIACKRYEKCTEAQVEYDEIFDCETKSLIPNPHPVNKKIPRD